MTGWIVAGPEVMTGKLNLPSYKSEPVLISRFDAHSQSEHDLYLVLFASCAGGT